MATLEKEKNPVLIRIGEKIRMLRKQNPDFDNYEVFAFTHKINKVTLQRIERGENYNMESLLKVLNALDVSLSNFFSDVR
ncbi:MAG: XRE family transcriptional regulator [Candidatus Delongbacteria bacterium]|nr:XRE family transcriptional regulator [Candidatus Delongbacteria bacterium]